MYYIYLDTKIIGAIQQLIVYFANQVFPYENTVVIYKKYKKHWQLFNKLFKNAGITAIPFERYSQIQMEEGGIVFYLFNAQSNCRIVSDRRLTHIFVTHGESNKISSVKPIIRIYDHVTTAGKGGIDRFLAHKTFTPYDIEHNRAFPMGDTFIGKTGLSEIPTNQKVILYAPTWEGGIPDENYSSLEYLEKIISAIKHISEKSGITNIAIKPHPNTGHRLPSYRMNIINLVKRLATEHLTPILYASNLKFTFIEELKLKKCNYQKVPSLSGHQAVHALCDISAIETQLLNENIPYYLFCNKKHAANLLNLKNSDIYKKIIILLDIEANPFGEALPHIEDFKNLKECLIDKTFQSIPLSSRLKLLQNKIKNIKE